MPPLAAPPGPPRLLFALRNTCRAFARWRHLGHMRRQGAASDAEQVRSGLAGALAEAAAQAELHARKYFTNVSITTE